MAKKLKTLFSLTNDELTQILDHLNGILTVIAGRDTSLSEEERGEAHASKNLKQFVADAANVAEQNPKLVPDDDTLADNKIRMTLIRQLTEILTLMLKVKEILSDTEIAAAIDSYDFGIGVYDQAKFRKKRGDAGMDEICNLLGRYFKARGKRNPKPPTS